MGRYDPWEYGERESPQKEWQEWEGSKRWEILIPVSLMIRFFRRLFYILFGKKK